MKAYLIAYIWKKPGIDWTPENKLIKESPLRWLKKRSKDRDYYVLLNFQELELTKKEFEEFEEGF